jgi:hypothetical protein
MLIVADTLDEIRATNSKLVGFFGSPPRDLLTSSVARHGAGLVDLDVYYGAPSFNIIPKAFCQIIRNCVDNAWALRDRLACVVAATGKEKCDAGRFAAHLIQESLGVEVIFSEREETLPCAEALLCEARGPLKRRVIRIMRSIVDPLTDEEKETARTLSSQPTHGFWGTPPHPIELLDLFPETTHIFGWTRCVEQDCPSNLELENTVPSGLPIVFFSQGFCQKSALAKYLAEKFSGIHVDAHDTLNAALVAKIEAFIRLSSKVEISGCEKKMPRN